MSELRDYLKAYYNALPNENCIIQCNDKRVTVITPYLLRIEEGNFCDNATLTVIKRNLGEVKFTYKIDNGVINLETEGLKLYFDTKCKITAESLFVELKTKPYTKWFYGDLPLQNLGGTVSTLDQINGECEIDGGVCSLDGYAVIDDSNTPVFDGDGWFRKRLPAVDLYFFGYGRNYTLCVKDYYKLTGEPELLPAYDFGNWWSRYYKYSADEYLSLMDRFKDEDIPFSVGIVDMDWHLTDGDNRSYSDGWTGYTWNKKYFPDYKSFLSQLKQRNIRTALNLHPASGVRPYEEQYEKMAAAMGIDPKSKKTVRFDCLNKKFLNAYFEILHFPYEADGVDFWWLDWQQGENLDAIAGEDRENKELDGISPLWMLNHMHYNAQKRDNKRGMIFSRYSGFGSQRYPIGFSGDTVVSWESLDFQVRFTATASNIGYSMWSHDIGGHMRGVRDDELNTRWIQFGTFSPILRLHSSQDRFMGREPWNFSKNDELIEKDYLRLRHKLFLYIYTMHYKNCTELIPIMRPMYHQNPDDAMAYSVPCEYWFGSEMVVAPITEKCDSQSLMAGSTVYLPDGKWIDWFDGYVYKGSSKFTAMRGIEKMPIFVKAGGIVPMQEHICHSNKLGGCDNIQIVVAAGDNGNFVMYEDDGISQNYKNGDYCKTEFCLIWDDNNSEFVIKPSVGNTGLIPKKRNYKVRFLGMRAGCEFDCGDEIKTEYIKEQNCYEVTVCGIDIAVGTKIKVKNDNGLIHDNSDIVKKAESALIHAQGLYDEKRRLFDLLNMRLAGKIGHKSFASFCYTSLSKYILELESQIDVKEVE